MASYDINNYTDAQLIEILGLDDPTDMELESRIVYLIDEYDGYDDGTPEKELYDFLAENGVMVDWREPNVIRMAPVPIYNSFADIFKFGQVLIKALKQ